MYSAFQIRIGGAKGVLMVKPDSEMKHLDAEICNIKFQRDVQVRLRESQIKFASPDLSLNVVRCATYSQGYLNRQLIILLNCLGVPDEVFLQLQRKAKDEGLCSVSKVYKKLMSNANKVISKFKKRKDQQNEMTMQALCDEMHLNLGPSRWF